MNQNRFVLYIYVLISKIVYTYVFLPGNSCSLDILIDTSASANYQSKCEQWSTKSDKQQTSESKNQS